jgi:hypothetical protein
MKWFLATIAVLAVGIGIGVQWQSQPSPSGSQQETDGVIQNPRSQSIADAILAEQQLKAQDVTNSAAAMLASTTSSRDDAAALLYHRIEELDGLRKKARANPDLTDTDKQRVDDALLFEEEAHERVFKVYHEQVMDELNREKDTDQ